MLELLFDLTFAVAVATGASQLAHGHVAAGVGSLCFTSFGLIWAWIDYSWFASAYDTDDWLYRLLTMVQIIGVVIFTLGIPDLFHAVENGHFDNTVIVIGYGIMRLAMLGQWVRAARSAPAHRGANPNAIAAAADGDEHGARPVDALAPGVLAAVGGPAHRDPGASPSSSSASRRSSPRTASRSLSSSRSARSCRGSSSSRSNSSPAPSTRRTSLRAAGSRGTRSTAVAPTCRDVWPGARMAAPGPCPHNTSRAGADESPHGGGSRH